jgi:hypothetical protein
MKKNIFLAVALAATTLFSCSNEDVLTTQNSAEEAVLTFELEGDASETKASGTVSDTEDVVISNYLAFVFDARGGRIGAPVYVEPAVGVLTGSITTTTEAAKVYIVANTGVLAGGPLSGVTTEASFKSAVGNLAIGAVSTQTKTNLWMSGLGNITFGIAEGTETKGTATVALNFVAAKIQVIVQDNRILDPTNEITVTDSEVVLLYAGAEGRFFADDKVSQTSFYSGDTSYPAFSGDPTTLKTFLSDAVGTPFGVNTEKKVFNHFYAFGNNGATKPTILAVKSLKKQAGETNQTIYYPIQFTAADATKTIEPGKSYTVTLNLKADIGSGGGGVIDPETPVLEGDVEITITSAAWTPVPVSKDFK